MRRGCLGITCKQLNIIWNGVFRISQNRIKEMLTVFCHYCVVIHSDYIQDGQIFNKEYYRRLCSICGTMFVVNNQMCKQKKMLNSSKEHTFPQNHHCNRTFLQKINKYYRSIFARFNLNRIFPVPESQITISWNSF